MKKVIYASVAALGVIAITVTMFSFSGHSEKTDSITVVDYFQGEPPSTFALVNESPTHTLKYRTAAAKAGLNIAEGQFKRSGNKLLFQETAGDATKHFESDAEKGFLSFNTGMDAFVKKANPKLPDPKGAEGIAKKFLTENSLMAGNAAEMKLQHVGGIKRVSEGQETDVMKTVIYTRQLGGVPVTGLGSKMIVEVGDANQVVGVTRKWREVNSAAAKKANPAELKSQAEAEAEFKNLVSYSFGNDASSQVNMISKLYYDGDGKFIQPSFLFEAVVRFKGIDGTEAEVPFIQPISMLKIAPEKISGDLEDLKRAVSQSGLQKTDAGQKIQYVPAKGLPKRN